MWRCMAVWKPCVLASFLPQPHHQPLPSTCFAFSEPLEITAADASIQAAISLITIIIFIHLFAYVSVCIAWVWSRAWAQLPLTLLDCVSLKQHKSQKLLLIKSDVDPASWSLLWKCKLLWCPIWWNVLWCCGDGLYRTRILSFPSLPSSIHKTSWPRFIKLPDLAHAHVR